MRIFCAISQWEKIRIQLFAFDWSAILSENENLFTQFIRSNMRD